MRTLDRRLQSKTTTEIVGSEVIPQPPSCLIREDRKEYQILVFLKDEKAFDLRLLLTTDRNRLHILAQRRDRPDEQYLWSFQIPKIAKRTAIQIEQRGSLSLIHIPKRRLLPEVGNLFPQHMLPSPAFAS